MIINKITLLIQNKKKHTHAHYPTLDAHCVVLLWGLNLLMCILAQQSKALLYQIDGNKSITISKPLFDQFLGEFGLFRMSKLKENEIKKPAFNTKWIIVVQITNTHTHMLTYMHTLSFHYLFHPFQSN